MTKSEITWLEYISETIANLGGVASLSQIYDEIEYCGKKKLSRTWKSSIRGVIERYSSDSKVFTNTRDIFYSVDGLGNGIWGLRNFERTKYDMANDLEIISEEQNTYRVPQNIKRIVRNTKIIRELKALHNNTCQLCNTKLKFEENIYYSEGHHIMPLGEPHNGPDVKENIIILCPNCHAMCDYGAIELNLNNIKNVEEHILKKEYVDYHNTKLYKK
ncbi:HNH endonuclease [Methanococcus voltae]|uniref:HNH endonuclease n=1 Tax=Methanococcus voltae TaxID=2188 RepID=UPI001AE80828|nr:HNH endonuclease [Methanococcus voltae]MBP2173292.1 hypothetical protein [Methanococcus voltae]